jgi:hypothetical protein
MTGFEPATSCSQNRSATKLRYIPIFRSIIYYINRFKIFGLLNTGAFYSKLNYLKHSLRKSQKWRSSARPKGLSNEVALDISPLY